MARFATIKSVGRRIDEAERAASLRPPMYDRRSVRGTHPGSLSGISAAALAAALEVGTGPGVPAGFGAEPQVQAMVELTLAYPEEDFSSPFIQSALSEVEDNRSYNPDESSPLRRISTKPVRRLGVVSPPGHKLGAGYAYAVPWGISPKAKSSVIMCIRRHARRGVILALGQGGGYHRPPRRSPTSDIWC